MKALNLEKVETFYGGSCSQSFNIFKHGITSFSSAITVVGLGGMVSYCLSW